MPDEQTVLYSLLGVALVLIAVIYFNNLRARQEAAEGPPRPAGAEEEGARDDYMLKFVRHEGSVVGETVAHDGGTLILKQAGVFKAVPVAQAELQDDEIVLTGDIDWNAAVEGGTAWHEAHTKGSDPSVSGDLTRSEDVRKPALEALKEKEGEGPAAQAGDEAEEVGDGAGSSGGPGETRGEDGSRDEDASGEEDASGGQDGSGGEPEARGGSRPGGSKPEEEE